MEIYAVRGRTECDHNREREKKKLRKTTQILRMEYVYAMRYLNNIYTHILPCERQRQKQKQQHTEIFGMTPVQRYVSVFIFVVGMQSGVTHEEAEDEAKKRKNNEIDKQFMAFCVKMKNENTIESESNKRRNEIAPNNNHTFTLLYAQHN